MYFPSFSQIIQINIVYILINLIDLSLTNVEIPRPRGVSLSRIALYDPNENFTCFDNSKIIPYNQVNDDYCDCLDGSDEPGTNACPNGSFYCSNSGYKAEILTADRVNDGICDCCDGTDEYSGKNSCSNNCLEAGRAAREEALRLAELFKIGKQIRSEMGQEGQKLKNDKKEKLNELIKNREEAEKIKNEQEELKSRAEEAESKALEYYKELEAEYKKKKAEQEAEKEKAEALEFFTKLDSNNDGVVDVAEIQTRQSFDRDRNGEVSEEEAKLFMANQESVDLETFIEQTWKLMKPFILKDNSNMYKPPVTESEQEEQPQQGEVETLEEEEDEEEEEEAEDNKEHEETEAETDDGHITYDEETQKLVDLATEARNQHSESERNLKDINEEIGRIEESLKKDFGSDEEFAALEGQCFDFQDHEYIYKLCPFDKTVQIPKSNSMETSLGKWSQWNGPENNVYSLMLYDRGQNCWNGPNRLTKVAVFCGKENRIISVSEPNRCEYAFDFETPAACKELNDNKNRHKELHDEL